MRLLRAQIQERQLTQVKKLLEDQTQSDVSGEWVSLYSDLLDRARGEIGSFGGGLLSTANDRRYGRNFPLFQTEQELALWRMPSRILCATNSNAIGLLSGLTAYVIDTGFTYRATTDNDAEPELCSAIQDVIDDFMERNLWHGGEQPSLEAEAFQRSLVDGEFFWCLTPDDEDKSRTLVRTVEPEQVTMPPGERWEEWSFGIQTPADDTQRVLGYYFFFGTDTSAGEEYDPEEVIHLRRNVTRSIKRGLPDFSFDTYDSFQVVSKLRRSLGLGAAAQAAIAIVTEFETQSKTDITGMADLLKDFQRTNPNTGKTDTFERYNSGSHLRIPQGQKYVDPPNAQNAAAHVEILQAVLRGPISRWNAPEWLGSADSSNNNFASSVVADSLFGRRVQAEQRGYAEAFKRAQWYAVKQYVKAQGGKLTVRKKTGDGTSLTEKSYTWPEIKRLVKIQVEAPTRNKLEEAQANQIRVQMGWKSRQTVIQEEGGDVEREQQNMEEWQEKFPNMGMGLPPSAGAGPEEGGGGLPSPFQESLEAKGTCKPGERADLTGCTPATADAGQKAQGKGGVEADIQVGDTIRLVPKSTKVGGGLHSHPRQSVKVEAAEPASGGGNVIRFRYKTVDGKEKIGYANTKTDKIELEFSPAAAADQRRKEQAAGHALIKLMTAEAKGTCKPGERADLTGCTPATADAGQKAHGKSSGPSVPKLKPIKARTFNGSSVAIKTQISKQEVGAAGEAIGLGFLRQVLGFKDARPLNMEAANYPVDMVQDHEGIEIKTGLVSNGPSAQQWRATIGQPGKEETAWLNSASKEEKAAWNEKKAKAIMERKNAALAKLSKELGVKAKGRTLTIILNPDTKTADVFMFDGFHHRIAWNSEQAKAGYKGTYQYA